MQVIPCGLFQETRLVKNFLVVVQWLVNCGGPLWENATGLGGVGVDAGYFWKVI
jgi:hypothetical protein